MVTWRDLGLERGGSGEEFLPDNVVCPYCGNKGHYNRVYRGEVLDANDNVDLVSDVWQCIVCANFIFVTWRAEAGFFDYRVYPYEKQKSAAHISWPAPVGHAYVNAINALFIEDWSTAIMMGRHSIGEATQSLKAKGENLLEEISDLQQRRLISKPMFEWAQSMTQLHAVKQPDVDETGINARELLRFCRYFFDALYTLPHDVAVYQDARASLDKED